MATRMCQRCVHADTHIAEEPCLSCDAEGNNFKHGIAESASVKALDTQVGGGHYKDFKIQPVEFIVANKIEYREANIIKYISRHQNKNGIEDIRKAMHYCQMIIDDYKEGKV